MTAGLELVHANSIPLSRTLCSVMPTTTPFNMLRDYPRIRMAGSFEELVSFRFGDGVNAADLVPMMGNFGIANVSANESWVTDGSWCPKAGNAGELQLARIRWSQPNALVAGG